MAFEDGPLAPGGGFCPARLWVRCVGASLSLLRAPSLILLSWSIYIKRLPALFTKSYCTSVSDITKSVNSRRSNTGSSTTAVAVVAPRWPFPTAEEPGGHAAVLPCARSMCHGAACRSGVPCRTSIRSNYASGARNNSTAVEHQDLQHRARGGPKP